ncbi:PiggyBac transposable element-derived protein, partial [Gonioctena quinquepunctata]
HEKLLICLELSDIEECDNEDDDSENENGNADGIREENVEEQSQINAENFNEEDIEEDIEEDLEIQSDFESDESDPEMTIPLGILKDQWGLKSWKKTDRFQPHIFETPVPEDKNMCACTNLKYRIEHDKAMNLSLEEIKKFLRISILMSCLKFPQIEMYWASLSRVSKISESMIRKGFLSIRSLVVDSGVWEEIRKKD